LYLALNKGAAIVLSGIRQPVHHAVVFAMLCDDAAAQHFRKDSLAKERPLDLT
jgi:hypothetical protein